MSAAEYTSANTTKSEPGPYVVPGVSMRDLLAAGAAARAISTPPRPPEAPLREQPKAA
ncbi:hypothetical protein PV396_41215 [Streptomyces sp. ME02-8801-2C]|uniref:hypothetical protein n=1 Tax=Streptomyces sp. ME02-8801-2C TaxID=3028680 RepID=UPI0029B833F3|nr:hypothetical protein [Streptomyces sp. ME02-8801-2C]MDX3458287.1 hypothetical protein [Streptomyces sp. ME02-8801-2C]